MLRFGEILDIFALFCYNTVCRKGRFFMKAIITVLGCDRVGIIAGVTAALAKNNINILDISQTIMQDIFTMIMLTDISESQKTLAEVEDEMEALAKEIGVSITVQHADIFHSMHRI